MSSIQVLKVKDQSCRRIHGPSMVCGQINVMDLSVRRVLLLLFPYECGWTS
jgi:hypothetical protein